MYSIYKTLIVPVTMKRYMYLLVFAIFIPVLSHAQSTLDSLELKDIFYEPLLPGKRPQLVRFSTDNTAIYYYANDSSMLKNKLYRISLDGTGLQEIESDSFISHFHSSQEEKNHLYIEKNNIILTDSDFSNPRKVVSTDGMKYPVKWAPDGSRFAYTQDGNIMVMNLEKPALKQLTHKKKKEPAFHVVDWAGNGKIIVSQRDNSTMKTVYFPEYIGTATNPGRSKRGYGKRTISLASMDADTLVQFFIGTDFTTTAVSPSGRYLALNIIDNPMKHRQLKIFDLEEGGSSVVFRDSTDGWLNNTGMEFSPEEDILMFHSERDGWNHLYTINMDGSDFRQITKGSYEIPWARWLDNESILLASTEKDPGERHLRKLNIHKGTSEKLTSIEGFRTGFTLSNDKRKVVYEYSYFNTPTELYYLNLDNPSHEHCLTYTVPERFEELDWRTPDYVRFTGRDSKTKLSMTVIKPEIKQEKHPVIVFVHGAGSLQNVYKGWSANYWREYMFHQFLAEKGYYVIEVDYSHSLGYGRDFREKVTNWMGKYETEDIIDGLSYLSDKYPAVNREKVGIYGGSYGGFMSLYAVSTEPEHFHAAAALRAVTNWENYYRANPWYTLPRLGSPEKDSLNYARSSPLTYVDKLDRPVLILHGLIDNNVPFRDAAQYIEKLIETGNENFDFMMYPSERHAFTKPESWYDEYSRIYRFFQKELVGQ